MQTRAEARRLVLLHNSHDRGPYDTLPNGLPASYHGIPGDELPDFLVHTEYGADCWTQVMEAGSEECRLLTVEYPAAQAIAARSPTR